MMCNSATCTKRLGVVEVIPSSQVMLQSWRFEAPPQHCATYFSRLQRSSRVSVFQVHLMAQRCERYTLGPWSFSEPRRLAIVAATRKRGQHMTPVVPKHLLGLSKWNNEWPGGILVGCKCLATHGWIPKRFLAASTSAMLAAINCVWRTYLALGRRYLHHA
jgi:hypothetical protein